MGGGRVQVDADLVHARVDHRVEALLQPVLRHVVLVLADADALGIDLHQLRQRILQPPGDGDGAADRHVQIRELLAGHVAGAVDAGAGLAHHHDRHLAEAGGLQRLAHEALRLAAGGAVADRDGADAALLDQGGQHRRGAGLARGRLEVHHARAHVGARAVDDGQLASGAQARIDAEHRLGAERRREQELPDVLGEDLDGRLVGDVAERLVHLVLDRGHDVGAQRRARGAREQRRAREVRRAARRRLERRVQALQHRIDRRGRLLPVGRCVVGLGGGERAAHRQHQLLLHPPAAHGQVAMRAARLRQLDDGLLVGEVVLEAAVRLGLVRLARPHVALLEERAAHRLPQAGVLRQPLDQDVAGAGQRGGDVGHALLGVAERAARAPRACLRPRATAMPWPHSQSQLASGSSPASFATVALVFRFCLYGQVEILEHGQLEGGEELVLQLGRQLALPLDLLDDERLALEDLVPGLLGVDHLANRDLVQVARLLLAVPRDERHGGALVRQLQDGGGGRDGDLRVTRGEPVREGHAQMIADTPRRPVIAPEASSR